jgi:hypothetical protein
LAVESLVARRLPHKVLGAILMTSLAACFGLSIPLAPTWSGALLGLVLFGAVLLPSALSSTKRTRLITFFSLFAIGDFVKRSVFLLPDQSIWSQYLVLVVPYFYYAIFLFAPWLVSRTKRELLADWDVLAYVCLATAATWLTPGYPLEARSAATLLLILPWTMLPLAASTPTDLQAVARILALWAMASAALGAWHFFIGPTIIEVNWAQAAASVSIGASNLGTVLSGEATGAGIWRPTGFQPDGFTFAMFLLNGLVAWCLLRRSGEVRPLMFAAGAALLSISLLLALVRTVWVAAFVFLLTALLFSVWRPMLRPSVVFLIASAAFLATDAAAGFLSDFAYIAGSVDNVYASRALTLGTLSARYGALDSLIAEMTNFQILGNGYASSSWITGKFGGVDVANGANHNFILETIWYTGLPGFVLLLMVFRRIFKSTFIGAQSGFWGASLIGAYCLALIVSGFGNGAVFLSFYFFFFAGIAIGAARDGLRLNNGAG